MLLTGYVTAASEHAIYSERVYMLIPHAHKTA